MPRKAVFDISSFPDFTDLNSPGWLSMQLQLLGMIESQNHWMYRGGNKSISPAAVSCPLGAAVPVEGTAMWMLSGLLRLARCLQQFPLDLERCSLVDFSKTLTRLSQKVQLCFKMELSFYGYFFFSIQYLVFQVHGPQLFPGTIQQQAALSQGKTPCPLGIRITPHAFQDS